MVMRMCLKRKIRNNDIDNLKDFRDNLTDAKYKKVIDDVIELEEHETTINLKIVLILYSALLTLIHQYHLLIQ